MKLVILAIDIFLGYAMFYCLNDNDSTDYTKIGALTMLLVVLINIAYILFN